MSRVKIPTNRVFYSSPAEAFDNYKVIINVQDIYEPVMPKFFSMTNTPPFFDEQFSGNMSRAIVPLNILVDIHTGKYVYELVNPEQDVPNIVTYLTWFIDSYSQFDLDKEKALTMQKIVTTRDFFKKWDDSVKARKANEQKQQSKVISFADGGFKNK